MKEQLGKERHGGSSSAAAHRMVGLTKKARWRDKGWRAERVCKGVDPSWGKREVQRRGWY